VSGKVLRVEDLQAWYGESQALRGVTLDVREGEVVTLVGRNGAGKTTTLRCVMGIHRQKRGKITLDGTDLARLSPQRIARLGVGYVQDDRGIYGTLSVMENLTLPPIVTEEAWSLDKIFAVFPVLRERARYPGTKLSGGEQQMLAIARVLRMGARILLMDEPTEGLAPLLVRRVGEIIRDIKAHGLTVLLVEQNLRFATAVADHHHLIVDGRTVENLSNQEVVHRERELLEYLGV
jgi:branched-chain amino acid transport system ATP-binding protein